MLLPVKCEIQWRAHARTVGLLLAGLQASSFPLYSLYNAPRTQTMTVELCPPGLQVLTYPVTFNYNELSSLNLNFSTDIASISKSKASYTKKLNS